MIILGLSEIPRRLAIFLDGIFDLLLSIISHPPGKGAESSQLAQKIISIYLN